MAPKHRMAQALPPCLHSSLHPNRALPLHAHRSRHPKLLHPQPQHPTNRQGHPPLRPNILQHHLLPSHPHDPHQPPFSPQDTNREIRLRPLQMENRHSPLLDLPPLPWRMFPRRYELRGRYTTDQSSSGVSIQSLFLDLQFRGGDNSHLTLRCRSNR